MEVVVPGWPNPAMVARQLSGIGLTGAVILIGAARHRVQAAGQYVTQSGPQPEVVHLLLVSGLLEPVDPNARPSDQSQYKITSTGLQAVMNAATGPVLEDLQAAIWEGERDGTDLDPKTEA